MSDFEGIDEIGESDTDFFIEPKSLEMAVEFSKRYTRLLLDRKAANFDMKSLKKEFNEQGLPTNLVIKAFTELRKEKKEAHKGEIEVFKEYISKNNELMDLLSELESDEG